MPTIEEGASSNAFEADQPGTEERTGAEAGIEHLRARGGVFVQAVRATRMAMAMTDPSLPGNPIIFANQSFLELSGYRLDEVLGQQPFFMNGADTDPRDAAELRRALAEDRDGNLETVQYRKNGSRFVANVLLSAFKDDSGRTLHHFLSWQDVTRRVDAESDADALRRTQAALRTSEERYRTLFETMDEAYAVVEVIAGQDGKWADFRFLEVNPAFMGHTGMPYPVGRTATELLGTPNPHWAEIYGKVAETGEPVRFEEPELTLGRVFDLNVFRLGGPGSRRVAVLFSDITERKTAEEALQRSAARDAYRVKLTDGLRGASDAAEAQVAALRVLGDHLGASRVMYGETDEGSTESFTNHCEYLRDTAMPSALGTHRWTDFGPYVAAEFASGRTLVVADIGLDNRHSAEELAAYHAVGIGSYLAVPLVRDGGIAAYLAVNHRAPHEWSAEEIALVEETAERTWAAVARARAEASLRESEERLSLVFNTLPVGVAIVDEQGSMIRANDEMRRFLPTGVIPSRDGDRTSRWKAFDATGGLIEPDNYPGARALRGETVVPGIEMVHMLEDGRDIWTRVASVPMRGSGGNIVGALLIVVDIDGIKRSEEGRRESEERFRQFGDASSDLLWIRDAETLAFEYLSPAFAKLYGVSREQVLEGDVVDRWLGLLHPEDRESTADHLGKVRSGTPRNHEFRVVRPDGTVRWLQDTDFPLFDERGKVQRIAGIAQDVTERRSAVERQRLLLAELQHRVRNILAMIRSVARRSAETSDTVVDYAQHLEGRINAMARTQALLTRAPGKPVDLESIVEAEMLSVVAKEEQVWCEGPEVRLDPKAAEVLTLAVHELATNAIKYGAFSQPSGQLEIAWRVEERKAERWLVFTWTEARVEGVRPTGREGFGTELITRRVPYELGGVGRYEPRGDGITAVIEFPLRGGGGSTLETGAAGIGDRG